MKQRPVAIGMLVCENAVVEEKTRNVTPVKLLHAAGFRALSLAAITILVAAFLTDGIGDTELEVIVQDL